MSRNNNIFSDPVAAAAILCCFALALIALLVFAAFVIIPVAALTVAGVLLYRYYNLKKITSVQNIPATVKERTDYMEPGDFLRSIQPRRLLNLEEEATGKYSCEPLAGAFNHITAALYAQESFHEAPIKPETTDRITIGRYYDRLAEWQRKVSDQNNFELFAQFMLSWWMAFREHLPPYALQDDTQPRPLTLTTPLQIRDEAEAVSSLIGSFFDADFKRRKLFEDIRDQIEQNAEDKPEPTLANYFAKTPFRALAQTDIPITLHDETRFAGMWVVAPQGQGKTTLLHALIKDDLERNASIVLMDSKGDLIEPFLSHPALSERRVVIGPDNPIGMNPLDIPHTDINKAVESIEYLFSSLLDFKLTGTQSMLLRAVLRTLIEAFPNPNLATFQELMAKDGEKKYAQFLTNMDSDLQQFFANEYNSPNIRERRQEVLQRLRSLLDHDLLRSMLMAPKTTFRIGEALDMGAVVIINNSRGRLGNKGAEFFGRFFIAQLLAAAQERSFRVEKDKKPVYFYIDEAHTVVAKDERITDVLHECRSQKIALCVAHQETSQVDEKVLSAFQNCAIRVSHPDDEARKMSISLRMPLPKLHSLRKGQFGAYVRGLSKEGIVVNVQKPDLSQLHPRRQPYRPRLGRSVEQPALTFDDALQPATDDPSKEDDASAVVATAAEAIKPSPPSPPPNRTKPAPRPKKDDPDFASEWE
jgi:Type IV secretion-system coupling protein DNA-binding domain